mmetsp:Transcript_22642/g.54499  ORF Transcript_22642/g.54499 Transcript_22642/m.54499 type:complete len:87 (+) Transcript_22642:160-420(+)
MIPFLKERPWIQKTLSFRCAIGAQCDKSDNDIIHKWVSTLEDTRAAFGYFPLVLLLENYRKIERFSKASDLTKSRHVVGDIELTEL